MDLVRHARELADRSNHIYANAEDAESGIVQAQLSTTYAILALVERIDNLSGYAGGSNQNRKALRVQGA